MTISANDYISVDTKIYDLTDHSITTCLIPCCTVNAQYCKYHWMQNIKQQHCEHDFNILIVLHVAWENARSHRSHVNLLKVWSLRWQYYPLSTIKSILEIVDSKAPTLLLDVKSVFSNAATCSSNSLWKVKREGRSQVKVSQERKERVKLRKWDLNSYIITCISHVWLQLTFFPWHFIWLYKPKSSTFIYPQYMYAKIKADP